MDNKHYNILLIKIQKYFNTQELDSYPSELNS